MSPSADGQFFVRPRCATCLSASRLFYRAKEEAMRLALDCALTERGFHSGVPAHKPDTRLQWKFYAVAFAFLIVSDENAWK